MIHHTVFFTLNYPSGSASEKSFFKAAEVLPTIPGVLEFKKLKEVSPKNHFDMTCTTGTLCMCSLWNSTGCLPSLILSR
jgi:hypothetical protein